MRLNFINPFWQILTLANLQLSQWQQASYLTSGVGLLRHWRQGSWLMQWADLIGVLLISLVFSLSPFVSNSLSGILLVAAAAFWFLLTLSDDPAWKGGLAESSDRLKWAGMTPIHLMVWLYWGVVTIATALSPVRQAALSGWSKITLYLLFFALMARLLRSPKVRSWIVLVYLHTALIVSVYGLRQWFFGADSLATWVDPTSSLARTIRVYSFLGNPNLLAGYLVPAITLSFAAVFAWKNWLPKLLAVLMVAINTICLVLTFSRGGWIGMLAAAFAMVLLCLYWWSSYLPGVWRTLVFPLVLGSAVAVVVGAIVLVPPVRDRVLSMALGRRDSSNNFRLNVWLAVLQMIRQYPLLGIGPGNRAFAQIYPLFQKPRFTALGAYSVLLEILVETGVIGFTCFLWLLLVTFNQGRIHLQRLRDTANPQGFWLMGAMAAMVGMLGHGLVDTVWYRPQINTLWWLMVALVTGYIAQQPESTLVQVDRE